MNSGDEYNSVADRQKAAQARVNSDLTSPARERLAQLTSNPMRIRLTNPQGSGGLPARYITQALNLTYEDVGYSGVKDYLVTSPATDQEQMSAALSGKDEPTMTTDEFETHRNLILNADTIPVLSYLENLLQIVRATHKSNWDGVVSHTTGLNVGERVNATVSKINVTLETEGILWELENNDGTFDFKPIGSAMMQKADGEFSVISSDKKWEGVVSPYQSAYNLYRERTYGREIPEKLYNSIEELARTICVDLQGWEENREQNLSVYLETMREKDLFEPNNIMKAELTDLSKSMERTFQKAGAERKNRHAEIDREYATLLLHQVSAHLTYVIRQYEEKYGQGSSPS